MRKYLSALLITGVAVSAFAVTANPASQGCTSGSYSGKTKGGNRLSFKVDCSKKVITKIKVNFTAYCQGTGEKQKGTATLNKKVKIKKQKGGIYYLAYYDDATSLKVKGVSNASGGEVFLRGTQPPAGRTEGTVAVLYTIPGSDPLGDNDVTCGGNDGDDGPQGFTAKR